MTTLFKDTKPPFGKYYISSGSNNSIITVSDTKVVFESVYNNEYTKLELTNPPTSMKDKLLNGAYNFAPVNIGSYNIYIDILYSPSVPGFEQPHISIVYVNSSTGILVSSFKSAKGVNQNPPPGFIQPSPITQKPITQKPITSTPATKSFFNKYVIYIAIAILLMIICIVGAYFFIKNRKPTIQTISKTSSSLS